MKNNWEETTLNDISILITKGTTPTTVGFLFEKSGIHFIKIESIDDKGNILLDKIKYISKECHNYLKRSQLQENDILCSISGAIGKISIVSKEILPANTNQALAIIRLKDVVYNKYIKYFLISDLAFEQFKKQQKGVAQLNLTLKNISDLKIKLPPLQEQKQIVEKIDKAFENIDKLTDIAKQNLENSKDLFNSYLNKLFTENTNNWKEYKIDNICNFVRGPFGSSLKKSFFVKSGYAVYEQQHAIYNQFDNIRYFIDEKKFNEMKRFEINSGDLIMSCSGTMGKIAIVPKNAKKGIINQALLKLTVNDKIVNNEFFKLYLSSTYFQSLLNSSSSGVAIKNIASVKILKDIKIKLPPLQQQKQIVKILDNLQEKTKKLEEIYNKKLELAKELKQSVLHKELQPSKV